MWGCQWSFIDWGVPLHHHHQSSSSQTHNKSRPGTERRVWVIVSGRQSGTKVRWVSVARMEFPLSNNLLQENSSKSFICLLKESRVYGLILYNLCYTEKWSCFAHNNLVFSLHLVKSNQNMSSKILLTLEVGVIIFMFCMFYIEIETKNVSFDVSKVHLKPEAYSVMLTLFCFV